MLGAMQRPCGQGEVMPSGKFATLVLSLASSLLLGRAAVAAPVWSGYAGDAQHTAMSSVPSQSLQSIHWQTPTDLNPQFSGNDLLIHYGSPLVTQAIVVDRTWDGSAPRSPPHPSTSSSG